VAVARRPHFGGSMAILTGGVWQRQPAKWTIFVHEIVFCHQPTLYAFTDDTYFAGRPLIGMLKLILCKYTFWCG